MKTHLETIRKAPIFKGIKESEMLTMLETLDSQIKHYRSGQVILKAGRRVTRAGVLVEGNVSIYKEGFWKEKYTIGMIRPGDLFAVSFAAASASVSNVTCAADEESVVLWLNLQDIFNLDDNASYHTVLIRNLMTALAVQNLNLSAKMAHITCRSTREKLLSYLSEESWIQNSDDITITLNRQQLADYLGVERSAMSAELSKLAKEGYFDYKRNHFILKKTGQ